MDFADNRRDEVIQYAKNKYGEDKVAQIGTFGTMMARGVVRDVARALGHPYSVGDTLAKLIPLGSQGFPMTIEKALEDTKDLRDFVKKDKDVQRITRRTQSRRALTEKPVPRAQSSHHDYSLDEHEIYAAQ